MQQSIVKEFAGDPGVVTAILNQGGSMGEDLAWVKTVWSNYYLRGTLLWDATGQVGQSLPQPALGLPFGRGFLIDPQGRVALPYFGHQPAMAIQAIRALKGEGPALAALTAEVSRSAGGRLAFLADGSPILAAVPYAALLTLSGGSPGFQAGGVHIPINPDDLTWAGLAGAGTPLFPELLGVLDARGQARPALAPWPGLIPPELVGWRIHAAVVTFEGPALRASAAAAGRIAL